MLHKVLLTSVCAAAFISLTACGGGSGGGGSAVVPPPPPPPPPPTNNAPTISISVSNMSPNEGAGSTLDGSGSSDADGDTLTYSWTQLSGPDVIFSETSTSVTDITVPNLAADTTARIQLQVSDGTATTSQEITLNLTNLVLTPVSNLTITTESTLSYPNKVEAIPTDSHVIESLNFLVYESNGQYIWDSFGYDATNNLQIIQDQSTTSDSANIVSGLEVFGKFAPAFATLGSEKVTFFDPLSDPSEIFSIDAAEPCALVFGRYGPENMIIGLRNGGAIVVELELDSDGVATGISTIIQRVGGTASLCAMSTTYSTLLAFDEKTNRVVHYRIDDDSDGKITGLTEVSSIQLDLDLPPGSTVEFVDSIDNLATATTAMALVFSDGETEGNHRLVVVSNGLGGSFTQDTYSWSYGAPTAIYRKSFDRDAIDTFVISTKASPQAVIFESGNVSNLEKYLPLSGPTYLDLAVGHGEISNLRTSSYEDKIIVSYPDINEVRALDISRP